MIITLEAILNQNAANSRTNLIEIYSAPKTHINIEANLNKKAANFAANYCQNYCSDPQIQQAMNLGKT